MKISGSAFITKDNSSGNLQLESYKANNGNDILKGKLSWYDKGKEDEKVWSNINFVAFGEAIEFIKHNCNELLSFKDCPISLTSYKGKDGTWKNWSEIKIFNLANVSVYQKSEMAQSFHEPKEPASNLNAGLDDNDDIPF